MRVVLVALGLLLAGCGADRAEPRADAGSAGRGAAGLPGTGGAGASGDSGVITACPTDGRPIASRACAGSLTCELGRESCCGQTHSSGWCTCSGGFFGCMYTDACYGGGSCGWGRPDAAAPRDAGAPLDAPGARDSSADAGDPTVCDGTTPVQTACAMPLAPGSFGVHCAQPFDAVQRDRHWCNSTVTLSTAECDGQQRIVETVNVDVGYTYYYQAASGALLAIFYTANAGGVSRTRCVAGPAGFSPVACGTRRPLPSCP